MRAGVESGQIKVLSEPEEIKQLYQCLIQSTSYEILAIISTPNALLRQHKGGLINLIKEVAIEKNVQVNLAIPMYEGGDNNSKTSEMDRQCLKEIEALPKLSQNITVRKFLSSINQSSKIKSTILLFDRNSSLVIDLKDDSKETFSDAVGLATYSDNRSRTQSYGFIFDSIWMQAELNKRLELRTIELEKLNETQTELNRQLELRTIELERSNEMLNQFVNVAAHELRTPTQAILGYSEMLDLSPERNTKYESAIRRNAQKLHSLVADILDVARIESQTLKLNKTKLDLNQEIESIINDVITRASWEENSHNVSLVFEPTASVLVYGDRDRINQVIQNLVNNAVTFTEYGTITIRVEKNDPGNEVSVTVKDTGTGIDKDIIPRLFMKFATKSKQGTGLGLFISKGIVEAHGGKIEAYNNVDGPGATSRFTISLVN